MEIEYQLSKNDYIEFSKLYIKSFIFKRPAVFIFLIILCIFPLSGETFIWWRLLLALIISPIIVFVILYAIPFSISVIRLNRILSKDKSGLEKRRLTIIDEGLSIESEDKTTIRNWESIASAQSNEKFIYLILVDKKYMAFPKTAFPSESEAINFLGAIQNKIYKSRGFPNIQFYNSSQKPNYSTGLLCLIPLIGAIAGIVFIINGIFKYKDKWLIIIGISGILWTVGVYSALSYSNIFGFNKLMVETSQKQINGLMKAVEFYKIKNGVYPDSLEQINSDNSEIWIYDPLQPGSKANKSNEYNYQKINNHYYLFSSGVDGIPNTKDDIYPQVAKSDSSKFGLIRKH